MKDNRCVNDASSRKYGLWFLKDDKTVSRKCNCCGIDFDYPITKRTLNQIKKQEIASKLLKSFLTVPLDDPNLIGYFSVILDEVIDYIDDASKSLLINRINELLNSPYLDDENRLLFQEIMFYIRDNNTDLFYDIREYFSAYNADNLVFVTNNKRSFSN